VITVHASGLPELERTLRQRASALATGIKQAVVAASLDVMSDARDQRNWANFTGGGLRPRRAVPGRRVAVSVKARLYKPLPPPGPLRALSGRLRNSIHQRVVRTATGWKGIVGTNVEYAPPHELGATIHQPPRSYLGHKVGDALRSGRRAKTAMGRRTFGARTIHIPPRPYLGPALERRKEAVLQRLLAPVRFGDGQP
jgi:phage gpG-like protein